MTDAMPTDAKQRKGLPLHSGVFRYFPQALLAVAHVSKVGNDQHNPGQPLHWDKTKSTDHLDALARHLLEHGKFDSDGCRHSAKLAWRALAELETEISNDPAHRLHSGSEPAPSLVQSVVADQVRDQFDALDGVSEASGQTQTYTEYWVSPVMQRFSERLTKYGCPDDVRQTLIQATHVPSPTSYSPLVYVSGPMRGIENYNFPAFDQCRDALLRLGCAVISPADIDRAVGFNETDDANQTDVDVTEFVQRDSMCLMGLNPDIDLICFLDGWERSTGAFAEYALGRWLGLRLVRIGRDGDVVTMRGEDVDWPDLHTAQVRYLEQQK